MFYFLKWGNGWADFGDSNGEAGMLVSKSDDAITAMLMILPPQEFVVRGYTRACDQETAMSNVVDDRYVEIVSLT
jgi:hypothetical protein